MKKHKKRLPICVMDCKTEEEWYAWTEIANLQHDLIHIQEKAKALEMYAGEELLKKSFYDRVDVLLKIQLFHEWLDDLIQKYRIEPLYDTYKINDRPL